MLKTLGRTENLAPQRQCGAENGEFQGIGHRGARTWCHQPIAPEHQPENLAPRRQTQAEKGKSNPRASIKRLLRPELKRAFQRLESRDQHRFSERIVQGFRERKWELEEQGGRAPTRDHHLRQSFLHSFSFFSYLYLEMFSIMILLFSYIMDS